MKNLKLTSCLFLFCFICLYSLSNAQSAFDRSHLTLNAGVLFRGASMPVSANIEYALLNKFGVGVRGHYLSTTIKTFTSSVFVNYHFINESKLDPFVGLYGQKSFAMSGSAIPVNSSSKISLGVQAGVRYLIINNLGVYTQLIVPVNSATDELYTSRKSSIGLEFGLSYKF